MNASTVPSVPDDLPATSGQRTPSKPVLTPTPLDQLIAHYNSQLPEYLAALEGAPAAAAAVPMEPLTVEHFAASGEPEEECKAQVVELIRKQNYRLGRFIRRRSIELLQHIVRTDEDGRTVGYSYAEILAILAVEFPEASTSAACLRWYVVHLWSEADEEGLPRPKMPQLRPRSVKRKAQANG